MNLFDGLFSRLGYVRYSDGSSWYNSLSPDFLGSDLMKIALENPVLFPCIEIRAKALSKVRFYIESKEGERDFDNENLKTLKNPNPHQSQQDFLKQYEWFKSVYGWVYQKPYKSLGLNTTNYIYNLNTSKVEFKSDFKSGLIFKKSDIKDYYKQIFVYNESENDKRTISFDDIIPFYDITNGLEKDIKCNVKSPSRVKAIIKSISNVDKSLDAENVIIQSNGRELFSSDAKGGNLGSSLPMDEEDKKNIDRRIINTGLGKGRKRAITTNRPISWQSLHIKARELALHESITNNAELVRSTFEVPSEVYDAFTKNKTYENQKEAEIGFYQNTIQPIADDLANSWTSYLGLEATPIKATFDHLPVMQHTEQKKADKVLKIAMAYEKLMRAGMTEQQVEQIFESQGIQINEAN